MAVRRLPSLAIHNFRAFSNLEIPRLAGVNLIVGKNNTGKTTVLEAIRLYYADNNPYFFTEILAARDEYSFLRRKETEPTSREVVLAFESLFWGRRSLDSYPQFSIGPIGGDALHVRYVRVRRIVDEKNQSTRYGIVEESFLDQQFDPDVVGAFATSQGGSGHMIPFDRLDRFSVRRYRELPNNSIYLPSSGMTASEIGRVWDTIALTSDEDWVIAALRTIVPQLERIVLVQAPEERSSSRILLAKLEWFQEPVPFRSLGDGALHLLGVALALIRARNGVLLVDEIENGIHYSVQTDMWRLIHKQAEAWNIQVFATTHSWDCVEGFSAASSSSPDDSALIRLETSQSRVIAVEFNEKELAIARKERIEVR